MTQWVNDRHFYSPIKAGEQYLRQALEPGANKKALWLTRLRPEFITCMRLFTIIGKGIRLWTFSARVRMQDCCFLCAQLGELQLKYTLNRHC